MVTEKIYHIKNKKLSNLTNNYYGLKFTNKIIRFKMKHIIASVFALAILASCANETVEPAVEETVDTTVVVEEEVVTEEVVTEEVVEAEGEEASAE
jgi:hypothetical protein